MQKKKKKKFHVAIKVSVQYIINFSNVIVNCYNRIIYVSPQIHSSSHSLMYADTSFTHSSNFEACILRTGFSFEACYQSQYQYLQLHPSYTRLRSFVKIFTWFNLRSWTLRIHPVSTADPRSNSLEMRIDCQGFTVISSSPGQIETGGGWSALSIHTREARRATLFFKVYSPVKGPTSRVRQQTFFCLLS